MIALPPSHRFLSSHRVLASMAIACALLVTDGGCFVIRSCYGADPVQANTHASESSSQPQWDVPALKKPPTASPATEVTVDGLKSIYLDGPPFRGKPTKFFAYYAVPDHTPGEKVPGIVLVHGGGATAYADWVKIWVARGYAAIALDHGGHLPIGTAHPWHPNPAGGPEIGTMEQIDWPMHDQWMYHAVADTITAYSFLESLPDVAPAKIGVTGISWGGVITSAVAGLDDRPRFFIPVYGCGYMSHDFHDGTLFLDSSYPPEKLQRWQQWWDPANHLATARAPMLWLTGSNDSAFTLHALSLSYQQAPAPHVICVKLRMPHAHVGLSEESPEIFAFADSIVRGGVPLASLSEQGREGSAAWAKFHSEARITEAGLDYTTMDGRWQDRRWETVPARIDEATGRISADIPAGTTTYFFHVTDARNCRVCTEQVSLDPPKGQP